MRKLRKLVLTLVLACALSMVGVPMQAKAATSPPTVDDEYVLSRLSQLAGLLGINEGNLEPGDGMYFTVNQQKCGTGESGHDCENCKNSNVANAAWFKNMFGTVYVGGFPKQYDNKGVAGSHIGYSCWGFANFAMWYATSTQNTDNVIGTLVTTSTFTKENILSIMRPGYIIRCNGHSMVFISADENKMKVMDCNYRPSYDVTNCRVRIREFTYDSGAFKYFKGKAMGITRAGNYDPNKSDTTPPIMSNFLVVDKDNTGYTICVDATDNLGVAKVCFPTWTEANGQDDLDVNWQNTLVAFEPVIGNTYSFRINTSDHNEEGGVYITDVYAFDASGNHLMTRVTVDVDKTNPIVTGSVLNIDSTGYTVMFRATDNYQVGVVKCASWTTANGQDDLLVTDITGTGTDNTYSLRINVADHGNASGEYKTEVQVYDISGNMAKMTVSAQVPAPPMSEAEKQVRAFVGRMYTIVLGRTADAQGLNDWTARLMAKQVDGATLVDMFVNSDEFINRNTSDEEYIKILYRAVLGREADEGGLKMWKDMLADDWTRDYILEGLVLSTEFKSICDSYGIIAAFEPTAESQVRSFVKRMYTVVLNRRADVVGLNDWTRHLMNGTANGAQVADGFISSDEFVNRNLSNEKYVKVLYRAFFNREPDEGGFNVWMNELAKGTSRRDVMKGFVHSVEFSNLCAQYGIIRGEIQ